MVGNIVLTGGSSTFEGFDDRMTDEMIKYVNHSDGKDDIIDGLEGSEDIGIDEEDQEYIVKVSKNLLKMGFIFLSKKGVLTFLVFF